MGLLDHKCDSCKLIVDALFPILRLDETPTGDQMVKKWYCISCWKMFVTEAEEAENDDTEEEKKDVPLSRSRHYVCGCAFCVINKPYDLWVVTGILCREHERELTQQGAKVQFNCGCLLHLITNVNTTTTNIYRYKRVCMTHEQKK